MANHNADPKTDDVPKTDDSTTTPYHDSKGQDANKQEDKKKKAKEDLANKQLTEFQIGVQKYIEEMERSGRIAKDDKGFAALKARIMDPLEQGRIKDFLLLNPARQFVDSDTIMSALLQSHQELHTLAEHAKFQGETYSGLVIMSTLFMLVGASITGLMGFLKGIFKGPLHAKENYEYYAKSGKISDKFLGTLYSAYKIVAAPFEEGASEALQTVGPQGKESFEQIQQALEQRKGGKKRGDEGSEGIDPAGAAHALGAQAAQQQAAVAASGHKPG